MAGEDADADTVPETLLGTDTGWASRLGHRAGQPIAVRRRASPRGDRYRVRVSDDGGVVGLWRR
jgi:hypothetical protein